MSWLNGILIAFPLLLCKVVLTAHAVVYSVRPCGDLRLLVPLHRHILSTQQTRSLR